MFRKKVTYNNEIYSYQYRDKVLTLSCPFDGDWRTVTIPDPKQYTKISGARISEDEVKKVIDIWKKSDPKRVLKNNVSGMPPFQHPNSLVNLFRKIDDKSDMTGTVLQSAGALAWDPIKGIEAKVVSSDVRGICKTITIQVEGSIETKIITSINYASTNWIVTKLGPGVKIR